MRVKPGHQKFNTPITLGTVPEPNSKNGGNKSVDEEIDNYLGDRRSRVLQQAKLAELEHVTEDEKTEAERARRERELLQTGKISPTSSKEGDMENTEKKVKDAAETAAVAASAGVNPEDATDLGTGKSKVVVIKPPEIGSGGAVEGKGWEVADGKPVRDPEGEYTFNQALKVARLEVSRTSNNGDKKSLGEELAEAKMKLEALGIKVGSPPSTSPRPLKEEVAESVELLRTLGIHVGTSQQASLKEQVTEAKSLLEGLGLSIGQPGESIEGMREKFRHDERIEELGADRDHKERLAGIADDMSERIGHGIATDMRHGRGGQGQKASGSNLPAFTCEECHKEFPISPEAEAKGEMTCPFCGMVYRDKSKEASEAES